MNRDDILFKKECEKKYDLIRHLLKKGKLVDASAELEVLKDLSKKWEDYERSVKFKSSLVKRLYSDVFKRNKIAQLNK